MDNFVEQFQEGLALLNDGELDKAAVVFQSLVHNFPPDLDTLFKTMALKSLASIYTTKGDWSKAILYYEEAFKLHEGGDVHEKINTLLTLGNLYADKGDLARTVDYYNQAIALYDPKSEHEEITNAWIDLGVTFVDNERFDEAETYFEEAIALKANDPVSSQLDLLKDIGQVFIEKKQVDRSTKFFEKAIDTTEVDSRAQLTQEVGQSFLSANYFDHAIAYFDRALGLAADPSQRARLSCFIGDLFHAKRESSTAITYYNQALSHYFEFDNIKGQLDVRKTLGNVYANQGQVEAALAEYQAALKLSDESTQPEILIGLGNVMANKGLLTEAITHFESALATYSKTSDTAGIARTYQYIGRVYTKTESLNKALSAFINALERETDESNQAKIINEIGVIYLRLGKLDVARNKFEQSLNLFDQDPDPLAKAEPLVNVGLILFQEGDQDRAQEFLAKGVGLLAQRSNPFDILNAFDEVAVVDRRLAFGLALKQPLGLLWLFSRYENLTDSNQPIDGLFWATLVEGTRRWWEDIFANRELIQNFDPDSLVSRFRKRRVEGTADTTLSDQLPVYLTNWRLNQLHKSTQREMTNETVLNMLFGVNDLNSDKNNNYEKLRDEENHLDPYWFVEVPLFLEHGERYLKIRLNNRVRRSDRLWGYPLLTQQLTSVHTIKVTLETQWLQRLVADHLFVPNNQWEYENYEVNPANTWLSDIYVMDLGENTKTNHQVELTYKIELNFASGEEVVVKTTNKRLNIPIYRKNNFQRLERFFATHNNALAILIATVSLVAAVFDISGNFIDYGALTLQALFISVSSVLLTIVLMVTPLYVWGRRKKHKESFEESVKSSLVDIIE